jgi:hypothetical protein
MLRRRLLLSLMAIPVLAKDKKSAAIFTSVEQSAILAYYGPKFSSLPPGQQKQLMKKGKLPPGIAKKMQPFPPDLERRLPPPPPGCRRVVVDQWAMLIADATNTVMDIIDLAKR